MPVQNLDDALHEHAMALLAGASLLLLRREARVSHRFRRNNSNSSIVMGRVAGNALIGSLFGPS
jgi:hypothetical protein